MGRNAQKRAGNRTRIAKPPQLPKRSGKNESSTIKAPDVISMQHRRSPGTLTNEQLVGYQMAINRELARRKVSNVDTFDALTPKELLITANTYRSKFIDMQQQFAGLQKELSEARLQIKQLQRQKPVQAKAS